MLLRFLNEDTSWVYNNEAIVALVGASATKQFHEVSLSIDELKSAFPFFCFDTPTKKDFARRACETGIESKLQVAIKERLALCRTDMLFVLSDFDSEEDSCVCTQYVEQLKENSLSFLVTHERNRQRAEIHQLGNKFCHVIFVKDDDENLFCPVKQLLIDHFCSAFGVDMADVLSVFPVKRKTESYFVRYSFANMDAMKAFIPELQSHIKARAASVSSRPDFMIFMNVPQTASLDNIDKIEADLIEDYAGSEAVRSYNFNADADDNSCTLLLQTVFPNQNIRAK